MYLDEIIELATSGLKGKLTKKTGRIFLNNVLSDIYQMNLPTFFHTWKIVDTIAEPRTTSDDIGFTTNGRWTIPLIDAGYQTLNNTANSNSAVEKFRTIDTIMDNSGRVYSKGLDFDVIPFQKQIDISLANKATGNIKQSIVVFKPCYDNCSSLNLDGYQVFGYINPPKVSPADWTSFVANDASQSLEVLVPFDDMVVVQGVMAMGEKMFFGSQTFHQIEYENMKQKLSDVVNSSLNGVSQSNGEFSNISNGQSDY